MPRICYVERRFSESSLAAIAAAVDIIEEYTRAGFRLTLRQLYYQFVARDLIPNNQREYKRLGSIVNDARLAGRIDWDSIEDRTRNLRSAPHWANAAAMLEDDAQTFRLDMWVGQPYRPEVWIEKDALVGVIARTCGELGVPYFACRGYTSQSEQWAAGRRFRRYLRNGQTPIVLHLGDHDPSGVDMTRDNEDRLGMFAEAPVEVRRLALNMAQIEQYDPPPNPAKLTDSRCSGYIDRYGADSWELDALEPQVIERLVSDEVQSLLDVTAWNARYEEQEAQRQLIERIAENFDDVATWLNGGGHGD